VLTIADTSRWHRLLEIVAWVGGIALAVVVLQLLGFDITGWLSNLWHQITGVPAKYLVAGVALQTGQTVLTGLSYYGILSAAYPGEVSMRPIIAAYAVGVAGNGFLPANIGTFVTLIMFIAIIPSCTFAGSLAAYLVQKIFFTIVGTFVYLYLFLSVPGTFDVSFGNEHAHPALTGIIAIGGAVLIGMLIRLFWRQVKKLWAQAKKGGAILATPRKYLSRVFLPSFLGYLCKIGVIAVFLAAFAIPVTFNSIMWVIGSGSLANVASFTPGAVGITQATNALALKTCCNVPNDTAVAYSTAQQLVTTAWNVIFALIAVVYVFGWTGGKQLVGDSYVDAKARTSEMREQRRQKKEQKKAAKANSPES
jgi:glycosyltransferase 2 family protein